jgi:tetratricopeptide (TPR) repeat protein
MAASIVVLAGLLLVLISALVLWLAKRAPYLTTGWFWFVGMLVPVIGVVQVGQQAWADRYTYLPSIGLFVAVVWGVAQLAGKMNARRTALFVMAGVVNIALIVGSSVQLAYWKNTRQLFQHVDRVTRNNPLSTTLLGSLLATEGEYSQAIGYYRRALSYDPDFPEAHFYLGHAFEQQGNLDLAMSEYEKAIWFPPVQEQTHIRMGTVLAKQQKPAEAVAQYQAALKVNPDSAVAHNNLAKIFHSQGRLDDAMLHYAAALELDPSLAQARNNLGVLLLQKGRTADGVAQLRESLRLKPGDQQAELNLAQALANLKQWGEAAELFSKAVSSSTADANAHYRYAIALVHLEKTREAMSQFASALLLQPDLPDALDGLSWILATDSNSQFRNGPEAVRMSERACQLTGRKDAAKLKTLAAAYAEVGRFQDAAATAQAAGELAEQAGRKELAEECRGMKDSFQSTRPWRQGTQP